MPMNDAAGGKYENIMPLRSGLSIYPSQAQAIDKLLSTMLINIPARFVLLCDISGQVIAARGDQGNIEPVALGALVASDLAASQEIARRLGEYQAYQITLREGATAHTFIAEAGPYLALLAQVDVEIPLGWARMMVLKNAEELAKIVDELPQELTHKDGKKNASSVPPAPPADAEILSGDENLTEMFGDALDDLWSE